MNDTPTQPSAEAKAAAEEMDHHRYREDRAAVVQRLLDTTTADLRQQLAAVTRERENWRADYLRVNNIRAKLDDDLAEARERLAERGGQLTEANRIVVELRKRAEKAEAKLWQETEYVIRYRAELSRATEAHAAEVARLTKRLCKTCNGHGEIGGPIGQTPESLDFVNIPCPDCNTDSLRKTLEEINLRVKSRDGKAFHEIERIIGDIL